MRMADTGAHTVTLKDTFGGVDWKFLFYRLRRSPLTVVGFIIVVTVVLVALVAPWLAPYDPNAIDLTARLQPPSSQHWAGTDEVGRDILSRVIYGARMSVSVGVGVVIIGGVIGAFIGAISGLLGGWVDSAIMRVMDVVMALPGLIIALALSAALGPSLINAMIALGVLSIPRYSRLARAQTLAVRNHYFVKAARVMGAKLTHQVRVHIAPNILSPVLVAITLDIGGAILAASALSFIGLGAQAPLAEWGAMVSTGRAYILDEWWYALVPGMAIVVTVLGFNFLGDGIRDLLDPKMAIK